MKLVYKGLVADEMNPLLSLSIEQIIPHRQCFLLYSFSSINPDFFHSVT